MREQYKGTCNTRVSVYVKKSITTGNRTLEIGLGEVRELDAPPEVLPSERMALAVILEKEVDRMLAGERGVRKAQQASRPPAPTTSLPLATGSASFPSAMEPEPGGKLPAKLEEMKAKLIGKFSPPPPNQPSAADLKRSAELLEQQGEAYKQQHPHEYLSAKIMDQQKRKRGRHE